MKKTILLLSFLSVLIFIYSCKSSKKQDDANAQPSTQVSDPKSASVASSDTKVYTITATPDSVFLGKNREALVRFKDMKAIELSDPDGKNTGIELTYKIELTNKNAMGGNDVGLNTGDFRLELDNGNKVSPASVYVSANADATKLSDEDKFELPAGTKPVSLNLFYDQTKASVKLDLK